MNNGPKFKNQYDKIYDMVVHAKVIDSFKEKLSKFYQGEVVVFLEDGIIKVNAVSPSLEESEKIEKELAIAYNLFIEHYQSQTEEEYDVFPDSPDLTQKNSKVIFAREMGITSSDSAKPILGAYSIGSSVAVTIYNAETKVAALALIDDLTDIEQACHTLIAKVSNNSTFSLEVNLVTKQFQNNPILEGLKEAFAACHLRLINLKSKSLVPESLIAIDARTGLFFKDFDIQNLDHETDFKLRIECYLAQTNAYLGIKFPLTLIYDGRSEKKSTPQVIFSSAAKGLSLNAKGRNDKKAEGEVNRTTKKINLSTYKKGH